MLFGIVVHRFGTQCVERHGESDLDDSTYMFAMNDTPAMKAGIATTSRKRRREATLGCMCSEGPMRKDGKEEMNMVSASSERLDLLATDGKLVGVPGTEVHYGDDADPFTDDALMDVFMGRVMAEKPMH